MYASGVLGGMFLLAQKRKSRPDDSASSSRRRSLYGIKTNKYQGVNGGHKHPQTPMICGWPSSQPNCDLRRPPHTIGAARQRLVMRGTREIRSRCRVCSGGLEKQWLDGRDFESSLYLIAVSPKPATARHIPTTRVQSVTSELPWGQKTGLWRWACSSL